MPKAPWRGDCKVTRWSAVLAGSLFFGVVDLFDDPFARLDIRSAASVIVKWRGDL